MQLPGRENRLVEEPFSALPALVEALSETLGPYVQRPFAFFGHSMGSLISFELARRLRRLGGPTPTHLVVSGRRAPQVPGKDAPTHHLPEAEFVQELHRLNGTPVEVLENAELMELLLPALRADFAICDTYVYTDEPPLGCSISAFGGLLDPQADRDELHAWSHQTRGDFSLELFPGDHFFLRTSRAPFLQRLSRDLERQVAKLDGLG